jgi:integrase
VGSIYRRKNSKNYWIKYSRHGKPYYEATRSDKIEVAKRLLKLREGEIEQGKVPGIVYERVKFEELMEDFLLDYRVNQKRTVAKAERCSRYLLEEFEGLRAVEVNTTRIKQLIEKRREQGYSNASINRELAALKRAFNLAVQCTPPKVPQVPYIPMLKENNIRKGFVEYEEFVALKDALPYYLKPVVTFAYFTGWRRGEILGLKWNQVNLRDGIIRLEPGETKNDEARTLYMEPELWEMMKDLHRNRRLDCQTVFHLNGKNLNDCRKSWKKACTDIGRPELLFHDLRRSGVRNMIRAGIPERVAMSISGHKTRSVFDRYNIVSQEDLKEAARRRQAFTEAQAGRLQFGDSSQKEDKKVVNFTHITR